MKKVLYTMALLALSLGAAAQNLNPTVEVTNTYKREASGIEKPDQLLPLPDSVTRFNYDFDYTVRNTPYRGSYEFKPYNVQLRPVARPVSESGFYAKLGAGFGFHPEAQIVWTPVADSRIHFNVYGDYSGYLGAYRDIQYDAASGYFADSGTKTGSWRDRVATAGADFRLDWDGGTFRTDVHYLGTASTDAWADIANNGITADAGVSGSIGNFRYFVSEHLNYTDNSALDQLHSATDVTLGIPLHTSFARLGLHSQVLNQGGALNGFAGSFSVTPACALAYKNLSVSAGIKVGFIVRDDDAFCPYKGGVLFPDISVAYTVIEDAFVIHGSLTGGNIINSYEDLLSRNHFMGGFAYSPDISVERINLMLGARGNVRERLQYNIKAGFRRYDNAASWGYSAAAAGYTPLVGYMSPLNTFYIGSELAWKSDHIAIDGNIHYQYTITPAIQNAIQANLFSPPAFAADVKAAYLLYGGRLVPALTLDTMSDRISANAKLPGYVDLGLESKFVINRFWGAYIKIGNLLNQSVQRVPFHAEKGIYFTLGASLNF
jgi:hypothetical protein